MQLSKQTIDILKAFANINSNLLIRPGKKIATKAVTKDIYAEYEGDDEFSKQVSVFNLNELLGVIGSFSNPELVLADKTMTIKENGAKVTYVYADEDLLTVADKSINMPTPIVEFTLTEEVLAQLKKMSGILAVEDLAIIGDGDKIIAKVFDSKNPTGNSFDIDLKTETTKTFTAMFKIDKLKLPAGSYNVAMTNKISQFKHTGINLVVYVVIEAASTF